METCTFPCQVCNAWTFGSELNRTVCDQCAQFYYNYMPLLTSSEESTSYTTPNSYSSSDTLANTPTPQEANNPTQPRKRRHTSESSDSQALVRDRKTRKLKDPEATAKVREKRACFLCMKRRKECKDGEDPEGSCQRCLTHTDQIIFIPGLLRPLCWRPNISTELFRRGPTLDFAASLRGNVEDAGSAKQALWKQFATRKSGREVPKTVQLSQGWTENTLEIQLDQYQPKDTDKQYYTWFENGVELQYNTPPYGITSLSAASSAIEKFLSQNFDGYIDAHMQKANEIARKTFQTAQANKHLPLVERALKLWVGCRFIEEPWSTTGTETLSLQLDPSPLSPYHTRIPVPPIVDLQIDLIVINDLLQPGLKKILKMLKSMLEASDPWTNWFEIYLSYFILLHNVELTLAHDAWFVKRHNLKRKFSNRALVETVMNAATTLLTCYHYAHQGFAPFENPVLEHTQGFKSAEKEYLADVRPRLGMIGGDHVQDPGREMFWTSQLFSGGWRPVIVCC